MVVVSDNSAAGTFSFFMSTTPFLVNYFPVFEDGFRWSICLRMSSNVFVCQTHSRLRLVVPRAASCDQRAAVKWCATNPQLQETSCKRIWSCNRMIESYSVCT